MLQAADVSWFKPFKDRYRELYENWLQQEERQNDLTRTGNPKAPTRAKMVEWVKKSLEGETTEEDDEKNSNLTVNF